jgi:hypothetical protein
MKAILGFGWTYGSLIVALCVGCASFMWLVAALIMAACGV